MNKSTALVLNAFQSFVAHKKSGIRFCLFKGENALEIFFCAAEQIQVVGDVLIGVEGVFGQQYRQLRLDPEAWAKRLFQKKIVAQRGFGVVVKEEQIKGQAIGSTEL